MGEHKHPSLEIWSSMGPKRRPSFQRALIWKRSTTYDREVWEWSKISAWSDGDSTRWTSKKEVSVWGWIKILWDFFGVGLGEDCWKDFRERLRVFHMDQVWRGLALLLEGVEVCCKGKSRKSFKMAWNEGVRSFKLELRRNSAGSFLPCSVVSTEEKRFSLVFPEGRDNLGGWKALAFNLRSIGVSPVSRPSEVSEAAASQLEDRGLMEVGEAISLQIVPEQGLKNSKVLQCAHLEVYGKITIKECL